MEKFVAVSAAAETDNNHFDIVSVGAFHNAAAVVIVVAFVVVVVNKSQL